MVFGSTDKQKDNQAFAQDLADQLAEAVSNSMNRQLNLAEAVSNSMNRQLNNVLKGGIING